MILKTKNEIAFDSLSYVIKIILKIHNTKLNVEMLFRTMSLINSSDIADGEDISILFKNKYKIHTIRYIQNVSIQELF